jgi:hypothetical protein
MIILHPLIVFFSALIRYNVDCTMATYKWLENISKTNSYKVYPDLDLENFHVEEYDKGAECNTGTSIIISLMTKYS